MLKGFWLVIKWFFSYKGLPVEPTEKVREAWLILDRVLEERQCQVCGKRFWQPVKAGAQAKGKVCPRLRCYLIWHRERYGNKG